MKNDALLPLLDGITVVKGGEHMPLRTMIVSDDLYDALTKPAACPTCKAEALVVPAHRGLLANTGAHGSTQPSLRPCDDPWHSGDAAARGAK